MVSSTLKYWTWQDDPIVGDGHSDFCCWCCYCCSIIINTISIIIAITIIITIGRILFIYYTINNNMIIILFHNINTINTIIITLQYTISYDILIVDINGFL